MARLLAAFRPAARLVAAYGGGRRRAGRANLFDRECERTAHRDAAEQCAVLRVLVQAGVACVAIEYEGHGVSVNAGGAAKRAATVRRQAREGLSQPTPGAVAACGLN